jgi:monoterpene epsilon-lactone hydrolase
VGDIGKRGLEGPSPRFCLRMTIVALWAALVATSLVAAETPAAPPLVKHITIPTTISEPAQAFLRRLLTDEAFADSLTSEASAARSVAKTGVSATPTMMGGVPVIDVRPRGRRDDRKVVVYTHGGGFDAYSARLTLDRAAPVAAASGLRVISVDYTLAPKATWRQMQGQIVAVVKALLAGGHRMGDIGILGDSAGGNLAAETVLNLREAGLGMPAAVVLWGPWADLTDAGDTAQTLRAADPLVTYQGDLDGSAREYAGGLALTDPHVSPVYADFAGGFPPTLIQCGTKEIFLSTCVRLYRKLDQAGAVAVLDIYEGMPHDFEAFPIPEADLAVAKTAAFFRRYLK